MLYLSSTARVYKKEKRKNMQIDRITFTDVKIKMCMYFVLRVEKYMSH